jgi:Spy/CpxP family protein refolding chaperone
MNAVSRPLLALLALCIFAAFALEGGAQEKQKKPGKKGRKGPDPIAKMLEGIELAPEQQAKVDAIKKEHAPKLAAIQKKRNEIMTPDRRRAEKDAKQTAKDAGKKGKEAKAAVDDALGLSPSERERLTAIQNEQQTLVAQISEQVRAVLTPEQRALMPEPAKKKKGNKKRQPQQ